MYKQQHFEIILKVNAGVNVNYFFKDIRDLALEIVI